MLLFTPNAIRCSIGRIRNALVNMQDEKILAIKIKEIDGVSKISFTSKMSEIFDETMENFENVVIV